MEGKSGSLHVTLLDSLEVFVLVPGFAQSCTVLYRTVQYNTRLQICLRWGRVVRKSIKPRSADCCSLSNLFLTKLLLLTTRMQCHFISFRIVSFRLEQYSTISSSVLVCVLYSKLCAGGCESPNSQSKRHQCNSISVWDRHLGDRYRTQPPRRARCVEYSTAFIQVSLYSTVSLCTLTVVPYAGLTSDLAVPCCVYCSQTTLPCLTVVGATYWLVLTRLYCMSYYVIRYDRLNHSPTVKSSRNTKHLRRQYSTVASFIRSSVVWTLRSTSAVFAVPRFDLIYYKLV